MPRRQKIRKILILISFLSFPITIFYMSPVLIIGGALRGLAVGSFLLFGAQFLSALVLGRGFCGWVCPGAGLQEACFSVQDAKIRRGDWLKWALWTPWLAVIVYLFIDAGGIRGVAPFFRIAQGISVSRPAAYLVYYGIILLILVPALAVGRRSFCHHICWMAPFMIAGRWLRNRLAWPALRLAAERQKCSQCGTCLQNCPMSLPVMAMVEEGAMERGECILCGTCIDGCPQQVISYRFGFGR